MTLDESTSRNTQPEIQTALGTRTWCLHLTLARPADLFVCARVDSTRRGNTSAGLQSRLRALAQTTQFDILFPQHTATLTDLTRLCDAFGKCTCDPQQPNLARMYNGKGGILLYPMLLLAPPEPRDDASTHDASAPGPNVPPYDLSRMCRSRLCSSHVRLGLPGVGPKKRKRAYSTPVPPYDLSRMCLSRSGSSQV